MFRMLKLKPPNGWNAVLWELAIVTVGVLMALALQQWAESLSSKSKATLAREAIRRELREHYLNAVEWRMFVPCVTAQLDRLERRIEQSRNRLEATPLPELESIRMMIRTPHRGYDDSARQAAKSDGSVFQFSDDERRGLASAYKSAGYMEVRGTELVEEQARLLATTRRLELDPGVTVSFLQSIDKVHSSNERMEDLAAEIIYFAKAFDAAASRSAVEAELGNYSLGMSQYCSSQGFPMRRVEDAIDPNS